MFLIFSHTHFFLGFNQLSSLYCEPMLLYENNIPPVLMDWISAGLFQ